MIEHPEIGGEENPFADNPNEAEDVKKAKRKLGGSRLFTPEDLCNKPEGLNALYTDFVIDRKIKYKGKGHESSDLTRILAAY